MFKIDDIIRNQTSCSKLMLFEIKHHVQIDVIQNQTSCSKLMMSFEIKCNVQN